MCQSTNPDSADPPVDGVPTHIWQVMLEITGQLTLAPFIALSSIVAVQVAQLVSPDGSTEGSDEGSNGGGDGGSRAARIS